MNKKYLLLFGLLLTTTPLFAQSPVTVTGTVVDGSNTPATSGYVQFDIQPSSGALHYYVPAVASVAPQSSQCGINSLGQVKNLTNLANPCLVWGNDVVVPANSTYKVTFAPNGNVTNVITGEKISGSSYNLNNPVFAPIIQITPQQAVIRANPFQVNITPSATNVFTVGTPALQYASVYTQNLFLNGVQFSSTNIAFLNQTNVFIGTNSFNGTTNVVGTMVSGNTVYVGTGSSFLTAVATCAGLALPSCTIDMKSGLGSHILVPTIPFDPGQNVAIKLLLGPFTDYTAISFVLRSGFWLEGSGSRTTTITSIGSNAQALFTIPQTNSQPAIGVTMRGVSFTGAAGNTSQNGLFADCSTTTNTGLWYSNFDDVLMQGFNGVGHYEKARFDTFASTNQWNVYRNLSIIRPSGGAEAIKLEGGVTNEKFYGGQADGFVQGDGNNIYVGTSAPGTAYPNTVLFHGMTSQLANTAVTITGVRHAVFSAMHHEQLNGGYNITGATALNLGITVEDSYFATTGVNAGNGYLLKNADSQASYTFKNNTIVTAPDKNIIGTTGENSNVSDNLGSNNWIETGTTAQMNTAATIVINHYKIVALNPSATAIATLQGMHAAGETVTFVVLSGGAVTFNSSGNLTLGSYSSPLILQTNQTVTFQRDSLNTNWHLISVSGTLASVPVDTTGLGANVGNTPIIAVPSNTGQPTGGAFRVCGYTVVTTAATTSSTLPAISLSWTDRDSNGVVTVGLTPSFATAAGSIGQTTNSNGGNTTTTMSSGCILVNAKAGTNINYLTSSYATAGATSMVYALHLRLEAM